MKKLVTISSFIFFVSFALAAVNEKAPPVAVNVTKASTKNWQKSIASTGTLIAEQGITVKSNIAGNITKIFFKSGQYVNEGTPLVQIYPDILKAQLKQNQALLQLKEQNYKRYTDLFKKKVASQSEFDQAQSEYSEAKAAVDKIEAELAQTLIKAPFKGYLGIRKVDLGTYVSAGDPIVNLEDTDSMFVDFTIPEVYSKKIKKGQEVTVTSEAYANQIFRGKVVAMESLINPNTRMLKVRARVPNKENILIPGSFVITKVYVGAPEQLIEIPQTAIQYSQVGNYVYVVENGKAIKTFVKLGHRGEKGIFILKGLKVGSEVVTAGQQRLYDGASVFTESNS